jgi:hypothetical protein
MAGHAAPPARLDGAAGSVVARTEPKVRAASAAAVITSVLLSLAVQFVPALGQLPAEVQTVLGVAVTGLVTGAVTWLCGYLTRAVQRVDLALDEYAPTLAGVLPDLDELTRAMAEEVFDRLAASGVFERPEPEPVPERPVRVAEPPTTEIPLPLGRAQVVPSVSGRSLAVVPLRPVPSPRTGDS